MKVTIPAVILEKNEVVYDTFDLTSEGELITIKTTIPTNIVTRRTIITTTLEEILKAEKFGEYYIIRETEKGFIAIEKTIRNEILNNARSPHEIISQIF